MSLISILPNFMSLCPVDSEELKQIHAHAHNDITEPYNIETDTHIDITEPCNIDLL